MLNLCNQIVRFAYLNALAQFIIMLNEIRKILKKEKRIVFAYLFGSALQKPEYANDIDIAIFVENKPKLRYEAELGLKIEKAIKKQVDVIVLNDKPLLIISEVLRNGRLIFSRDEKRRVKFETANLSEILSFNELMKEFEKRRFERYGIR
jgi:predicted nucleotidyltransferase